METERSYRMGVSTIGRSSVVEDASLTRIANDPAGHVTRNSRYTSTADDVYPPDVSHFRKHVSWRNGRIQLRRAARDRIRTTRTPFRIGFTIFLTARRMRELATPVIGSNKRSMPAPIQATIIFER